MMEIRVGLWNRTSPLKPDCANGVTGAVGEALDGEDRRKARIDVATELRPTIFRPARRDNGLGACGLIGLESQPAAPALRVHAGARRPAPGAVPTRNHGEPAQRDAHDDGT